jgi:hypothetical protein
MSKTHRSTPAKRPLREIEAKRNRDQRRQQAELRERYERRADYPEREHGGYKP